MWKSWKSLGYDSIYMKGHDDPAKSDHQLDYADLHVFVGFVI